MKISETKFRIALARNSIGIKELSSAINVSTQTLYAYTSSKRNPSTKMLGIMANALNVDVTELIDE